MAWFAPQHWLHSTILALLLPGIGSGYLLANTTTGVVLPIPASGIHEIAGSVLTTLEAPRKAFEAHRKGPGGDPASVFKVICDFNPDGLPNRSENFGDCYELAKKLRDLQKQGVRTVAYVHGDVSRHSVLPVLACAEIVLSRLPVATLGPVTSPDRPLEKNEADIYEAIATGKVALALVRKLYDPAVEVLMAPVGVPGDRFRDGRARPRPEGKPVEELGPGTLVTFSFERDRTYGLIQSDALNSLEAVLQKYGLPREVLRQTPTNPVVCRTTLNGPVNGEMREKVARRLKTARERKATLLLIELACGEGDVTSARRIAEMLMAAGEGDHPIYTIAYVKSPARNLATVLAFACDRIVMHPRGKLGDFESYLSSYPRRQEDLTQLLTEVATKKHYPVAIALGMLDRNLVVHRVKPNAGGGNAGEPNFMTDADYQDARANWIIEYTVKPRNENERNRMLTLDAPSAREERLAHSIEPNIDNITGVTPDKMISVDGDLLERIADFLRDPWTSYILLMVGLTCLILEFKLPGVVLPGVVSAVCFVLYFWSHSQFNGEIVWLSLLLFFLGVVLLLIELFVLPGFGVCGVGGVACILGALGLIGLGQIPRTGEDWANFGNHVGYLLLGMFLAVVAAVLIVQYLPHLPFVNQLLLKPAEGSEDRPESQIGTEDAEELLGAIGVSATPLRPAGKMQIGDRFLDVVAEGGYIMPGTRLQIVEIEGNRIVVKEI